MSELINVEVMASRPTMDEEFDYELIGDPAARDWAESAAGFITFGLGQAVVKVLEAGNLLIEAKQRLAHGEYLPWVQQACGLKPQHAQKLIKAAEWANAVHARHLDGVTDATTLFLLSADTTTEEVREWFMERCAAGDVPSRAEVAERKRRGRTPRTPQPAETLALTILRRGELDHMREALALADRAKVVTADQVMAEQRLRELGKQRFIAGLDADFHRMKDGQWIRLPHAAPVVDVAAVTAPQQPTLLDPPSPHSGQLVTMQKAATLLGLGRQYLANRLTPSAFDRLGPLVRNGYQATKEGRGMVRLTPSPP
jgi:hypothetical protein